MVTIVQNGDKVLRKISQEIPLLDITKPKIQKIISEMNQALDGQYDGVAIAAPQIGVSLRMFIMSGRVFDDDFIRGAKPKDDPKIKRHDNLVFINPIFKKISKDKKLMAEGCLSVRPIYGKVRRATRATIEAYNEKGKKFTMDGSGLIAHIFQHENDHLDGVLFIDKAKDLHDSYPEEEKK
jgi:peptide deformylase